MVWFFFYLSPNNVILVAWDKGIISLDIPGKYIDFRQWCFCGVTVMGLPYLWALDLVLYTLICQEEDSPHPGQIDDDTGVNPFSAVGSLSFIDHEGLPVETTTIGYGLCPSEETIPYAERREPRLPHMGSTCPVSISARGDMASSSSIDSPADSHLASYLATPVGVTLKKEDAPHVGDA